MISFIDLFCKCAEFSLHCGNIDIAESGELKGETVLEKVEPIPYFGIRTLFRVNLMIVEYDIPCVPMDEEKHGLPSIGYLASQIRA